MKNKITLILFIPFLFSFFPDNTRAQPDVHLALFKEAKKKISIAIPQFIVTETNTDDDPIALEGTEILKNDLNLSGFFDSIEAQSIDQLNLQDFSQDIVHYSKWQELGVHALIKGEYASTQNGITFKLRLFDISNKKYLIGKLYRGRRFHLRKLMHKFADVVEFALTKKEGVAQTKISFVSFVLGHKELFVIDYDGHNLKQITKEKSLVLSPDWSPDGKKIAYTSYSRNNPDLKVISVKGKKKEKVISSFPGLNVSPAWSPDGKKIAYTASKDGNPEIYLLNTNGEVQRITHYRGIDTSPTWSPDGKKIAFTSDRSGTPQIYIMDVKEGGSKHIKRISFSGSYNDLPVWSPGGDKIAYSSLQNNHFEIVVKDLIKKKEILVTRNGHHNESPSWSPNGRFLAFSSTLIGKSEIYVIQSNGTGIRRLTNLEGGGFSPAWSPVLN